MHEVFAYNYAHIHFYTLSLHYQCQGHPSHVHLPDDWDGRQVVGDLATLPCRHTIGAYMQMVCKPLRCRWYEMQTVRDASRYQMYAIWYLHSILTKTGKRKWIRRRRRTAQAVKNLYPH